MTGHPAEGRAEFLALLQFLQEFPFDRLGAFAYSRELGTRSATLPRCPEPRTAQRRQKEVLALQQGLARERQRLRCGRVLPVLAEGVRMRDRLLVARSYAEAPEIDGAVYVQLPSAAAAAEAELGEFMSVRITGADAYDSFAVPTGQDWRPTDAASPAGLHGGDCGD
jgi:ribosomal protein S12 methylthiotransferase